MVRLRWPGSKVDGAPEKVDARAGKYVQNLKNAKGWLAIAKLKPLSLFISLFLMLKKAFDNVKIEK